jgi:hypothetical protein
MAAAHAAAFAAAFLRKLPAAEAVREQDRSADALDPGPRPATTQIVIGGQGGSVFAVQNGNIYTHPSEDS